MSDSRFREQIISYLTRELRALGDVSVVDKDAEYSIEIVGLHEMDKAGRDVGFALSVIILRPPSSTFLPTLLKNRVSAGDLEVITSFHRNSTEVLHHWVRSGGSDDLKHTCEQMITAFDTRDLIPSRKRWDEWRQQIVEYNKKQWQ